MNKNLVVYTTIINPSNNFGIFENYDTLKTPAIIEDNIDYICFTNNPKMKSNIWNIINTEIKFDCPVRSSREMKILPHKFFKEYEYSVYVDGSTQINNKIYDFSLNKLKNNNFCIRKHDKRKCVYDEAKKIIEIFNENPKDTPENILKHIEKYKKRNFPKNAGLRTTGVLIRRHNESDVINCMNSWWQEYINGSKRDQLSLPYAIFDSNIKLSTLSHDEHKLFFTHKKHRIKYGKIRKV